MGQGQKKTLIIRLIFLFGMYSIALSALPQKSAKCDNCEQCKQMQTKQIHLTESKAHFEDIMNKNQRALDRAPKGRRCAEGETQFQYYFVSS